VTSVDPGRVIDVVKLLREMKPKRYMRKTVSNCTGSNGIMEIVFFTHSTWAVEIAKHIAMLSTLNHTTVFT